MNETITLNNGVEMPRIGYGVYQIPAPLTERCVSDALSVGYRAIDTAQCYGNERAVGKAVRSSAIPRVDIFITTKLWSCRAYKDTLLSIDGSLRQLDTDYIDLLLIHEPTGDTAEIYRAMEDALDAGKIRAIGVSNFLGATFDNLVSHARIPPAVNQLETHVFRQQRDMRERLARHNTALESWSPLAEGRNGIFSNPALKAIAASHQKTVAQIALRFLYQQGIIIIPKTTHRERMEENRAVTDFSLSENEMREIETLDTARSQFGWW